MQCSKLVDFLQTKMKRSKHCLTQYPSTLSTLRKQVTHLKSVRPRLERKLAKLKQEILDVSDINNNDKGCTAQIDTDLQLEDHDSLYLVNLLKKVLQANRQFNGECFLYNLIKQQLLCLLQPNGRGFQ